ncbi:MAG: ribonuclease R [Deltaproteobacteria bacterium]|nr:ribonuclease R [Deltaproteobacteria bacterium]
MKIGAEEILKFMEAGAKTPVSLSELGRALEVPGRERGTLKRLMLKLAADGAVVKISDGRYGLTAKMNLVSGVLQCHPDGFGFVAPEWGGEDVFINPRKLRDAMHGDRVVARIDGCKKDGRREGSVIRVLERAHKKIVGRFKSLKGASFVVPSDERILGTIVIPPGQTMGAGDGVIVEAEITKWPEKHSSAVGRIAAVMGDPEDPDVEIEVIAKKYGLPHRFPPDVLHEARGTPMEVAEADMKGRTDLRGMNVFTIDGESAKDFDDAVAIERTGRGYRLLVSIADVSRYVPEGSRLDAEAYSRGTSVYFPDRCIPMLPEALSNGICSLNPRVERLTLTAELEFDGEARPVKKKIYESVIKSVERFTYTKVKKILCGEDPEILRAHGGLLEDLKLMEELALKLNKNRLEGGSIDFDLPEPQIIIDIEGRPQDIVRSERNIAHRIIEEFMLAANRAAAEFFSAQNLPFLYRVHERPSEADIAEFREFAGGLGYHLAENQEPGAFQRLLKSVEGRPEERLINRVLLRSMKQAVYSEKNAGHFGLAFENYTHFTSPIRRYPDLVVHRLIKRLIHRRYTKTDISRMEEILPQTALHASQRERKAMEAEREIVDLKKAQFMQDKVGEAFDGFISGVTSFGFFVELKDYFVEGLVHVTSLGDDYYTFAEKEHALVGENTRRRFRLGSETRVRINAVDIGRRRIDLALAEGPSVKKGRPGRRLEKGGKCSR